MLKINPAGVFSRPLVPNRLSRIAPNSSLPTLLLNPGIQFVPVVFAFCSFNLFTFIRSPKSPSYGDRTIIFVGLNLLTVTGFWWRDVNFVWINFFWIKFDYRTFCLVIVMNSYCVVFYTIIFSMHVCLSNDWVGEVISEWAWWPGFSRVGFKLVGTLFSICSPFLEISLLSF